jgi:DNA (cytosine-5)-methyltransferase 1
MKYYMAMPHLNLKYIDVFAGCGGVSLGFYNAGWRGLFALEKSEMAFETFKHNLIDRAEHFDWPSWLPKSEHDITCVLKKHGKELEKLRNSVDLVAGGPPCQGFSLAGRRDEKDERNELVNSYIEFVSLVRPRSLFFENVRGFTVGFRKGNSRGEAYSERVLKKLRDLEYRVKDEIVDFSEFGVPQRRRRYILFGVLSGDPQEFFTKLAEVKKSYLQRNGLAAKTTLGEAISDLERKHGEVISHESETFRQGIYGRATSAYQKSMRKDSEEFPDSHRFANHKRKTVEKFKYIIDKCPKGIPIGNEIKKMFKLKKKTIIPLDENNQCPTLTTLPDDYIHYSEPRILTVREYARIQSFNDWFEFRSRYTTGGNRRKVEVPRYTQVGNAVPPLFAELSANVIGEIING